ncbi:MAG: hypothetical protein JWM19_4228 [Actinomycetia bacterium]|nr:hypothetical protein [Actinomycetes bacterium]
MTPVKRPVRSVIVAGVGLAASLGLAVAPGAARAASPGSTSIVLAGQEGAVTVDQATNIAYVAVTAKGGTTAVVYAVNVATGKLVATIAADYPLYPSSLVLDPGTGTLYMGSAQSSSVTVISTATDTVTGTISLPHGDRTFSLAFDTASSQLFVGLDAGADGAGIAFVDPLTNTITSTITRLPGNALSALAVDSADHTLYAGAGNVGNTSTIYAINTDTDAITHSFAGAGPDPMGIGVDTADQGLYVDYFGIEARYDLSSYRLTGSYTSSPVSLAFALDPATGLSYTVGLGSGFTLRQINSASTALNGQIPVPRAGPMDLDQATDTLVLAAATDPTTTVLLIHRSATGSITSHAATTFTTGKSGTFTAKASGTPDPFFSLAGKLPAGVTFSRTGVLSGTPARGTGGVHKVTITASNGLGSPVTQHFTLTIDQPAGITSANHVTFTHGKRGNFTVRTTGYPVASVTELGTLPAGLKFTVGKNGTATISGTPAKSAKGKTYIIRLTATNKVGAKASQRFTLKVS